MDAITEFREAIEYARALIILARIAECSFLGRRIHYGDRVPQLDAFVAQLHLRNALAGGFEPNFYYFGIG